MQSLTPNEQLLNRELLSQPSSFDNRWTHAADCELRRILFRSLAAQREDYLRLFFPNGVPPDQSEPWSLRTAQGALDGAEYLPSAKGNPCGHIFKNGESTYSCKTCAADDTCVLCAKCFDASDHDGHSVLISVSPGNSGCCDCGDKEAWRREVRCTIHTANEGLHASTMRPEAKDKQKAAVEPDLPVDLQDAIRMTLARCADYLCDVFSCSPEQQRLPKSEKSVLSDERNARLGLVYGNEVVDPQPEFALVLWNDEKHTVDDVQNQVARSCSQTKKYGYEKAMEVNDMGRSIVKYSRDLKELLAAAEVIEQLKLTVTIRSARDTFREQMCATIIDWIADIAGCAVGDAPYILRNTVCEELLKPWQRSSDAYGTGVGEHGIDDHEIEDNDKLRRRNLAMMHHLRPPGAPEIRLRVEVEDAGNGEEEGNDDDEEHDDDDDDDDDGDGDDGDDDDDDDYDMDDEGDDMELEFGEGEPVANVDPGTDMDIDILDDGETVADVLQATLAGHPPPAPPPAPQQQQRQQTLTPQDSDEGEAEQARPPANDPYPNVPKTPRAKRPKRLRPSKHWLEKPDGFKAPRVVEPCEDLWQRVRLDFLILYDLRLWKTLRVNLRHLYITTVVTIPRFKRVLGLRFAGLYTALAQLYLIADREPDHSIINLSVQMLTTPTITHEVVQRGNFLTNLMAILYTFLTTRQVGFPEDVHPKATLAFDAGAVTNRRMFHFFLDLRWLFQAELIHHRMRNETRYLLQFLDLVKLHQGVCPNVRAVGDHVEYESDAWIGASMIVKEVNKLCKQVAVSFESNSKFQDQDTNLHRAIRVVGQVTMINAFGYERKRFCAAELKDDLAWHMVGPIGGDEKTYSLPKLDVQKEPMSFHHPLHYLLSWLLENAKGMTREEMRALLHFSPDDLKDPFNYARTAPAPYNLTSDELLSGIFDHPLRVCVWLAQMKAGMWVRNGITLRHQAHTYRSVSHRDVGYQRDILMVQAGLVLCGADVERPGERYLAQMIDRFQIVSWVKGIYEVVPGFEEPQQLDCIEDFFHLLVIALSERGNLIPSLTEAEQHDRVLQHDIAHALCFKPLSFSELAQRVTEKVGESDDFQRVLESMSNFRPPEGLSDTGTFELKPDFIELVDPYYAHYSRNYREEAEQIYKKHIARKNGKKVEDVIYEPSLEPIECGLFSHLAAFTSTPLFVQSLGSALNYAVNVKQVAPKVQVTRVETFLHMVLHLTLLAVLEDRTAEGEDDGFIRLASSTECTFQAIERTALKTRFSFVMLLIAVSDMEDYTSCHAAIKNVLRKMQARRPDQLNPTVAPLGALLDRADTGSPASLSAEDKERKKQEAKARQAKIMAQMKQQQNSFLQNQGMSAFDHEEYDDLGDDMSVTSEGGQRKTWNFPTGTCILCQEETDDSRLYGTFAFFGESSILRSTPMDDTDYVKEIIDMPESLDRSAAHLRPFGVASSNKQEVQRVGADGKNVPIERQGLAKGYPHECETMKGPVSTSCGHIMHYHCFELYLTATQRRHAQQIARNHPERVEFKEFTCPLCKALGNTFLPIIWKAKECTPEHELHAAKDFKDWLADVRHTYQADLSFLDSINAPAANRRYQQVQETCSARSFQYVEQMFAPLLMQNMQDLTLSSPADSPTHQQRYPLRSEHAFSRIFNLGSRRDGVAASGSTQSPASQFHPGPDQSSPTDNRMGDLFQAYRRIEDSIRVNELAGPNSGFLTENPIVAMSRALGISVSAWEIAHRGVGSSDPFATSLIKDLPEQTLTHLRIVSETIESYLAVNILRSESNIVARETIKKRDTITAQLFGIPSAEMMTKLKEVTGKFLFQEDIFLFFADWLSFMGPTVAEASSILQLCFWAEVVKAVFVLIPVADADASHSTPTEQTSGTKSAFELAVRMMAVCMGSGRYTRVIEAAIDFIPTIRRLVDKYALTFLRKSAVLMSVRYGLDFECPYNMDPELPETERLIKLLHMPSLDEICKVYTSQDSHAAAWSTLNSITARWLSQAECVEREQPQRNFLSLQHPAIFELIGLPKNYDTLTEEAIKRRCPTTGKEISDPALCLHCGAIFCSQGVCCLKEKSKGGCYQHMASHGLKTGMFINIRKCMVLFLHGSPSVENAIPATTSDSLRSLLTSSGAHGTGAVSGSFLHAPYLDRHGEPDPTLRRHHQLFLNAKRYDRLLREVWLKGGIRDVVARKLEGDSNPGGWETL